MELLDPEVERVKAWLKEQDPCPIPELLIVLDYVEFFKKALPEAKADAERLRNSGSHKPWCSASSSVRCSCGWRDAALAHDKLRHPANGG